VQIAGWIWLVIGSLSLFTNLLTFVLTAPQGAGSPLFGAIIGAVFCHVGLQSVQGKAKDTLGNGIGSLILGLLQGGLGIFLAVGAPLLVGQNVLIAGILGGIAILGGSGLIAAGVLALIGRKRYKAWRRAQNARDKLIRR
jgi:hypothetical protein